MKTIRIILLVLIIVGIVLICTQSSWVPNLVNKILVWQGDASVIGAPILPIVPARAFNGKNSTFAIDGENVTLVNGLSETSAATGSASKIITRYFGNEATGDLSGDGRADTAFLVTQSVGGSGLFYYVVVALKTPTGYKTTNAFLIGDRIAPQTTEIHSGSRELYVNFAERKAGEPMTAKPSVGATLFLKVTPNGVLEGLMK